ncbi:metal-dependent hydrolase [Arachidicoccus ginsenosidimutans]|nr:metal-dependent hydrolase [Arachidicoccus sp. BS20]
MPDLHYPIGKYEPQPFSEDLKKQWLNDIASLPERLEYAIINLDEEQLQTPYRGGGWTVHQLVHHIADSHMNAYIRFKWVLTENNPTIKTYNEKLWAELNDVKTLPVNISITLLHALHRRWVSALQDLSDDDWNKTLYHPEAEKELTLWYMLGNYAWHGKHHTAHINALRERMNW